MTDEEVEKIIKRNMNLQMNLAGIRADFEEATQRKPLTPAEVHDIWCYNHTPQEIVSAIEAAHGIYAPTELKE